eukprot:TRINITY_DN21143_c0_g1_i1.p1 TRINITY_DN21143_c0_g1~~TRINITY_DN21143_c0_g1_i1.p1  ORF type:complete len:666 (-),score=155.24 TRINITY_DN21143_c0_g1_i1:45-2042(-)
MRREIYGLQTLVTDLRQRVRQHALGSTDQSVPDCHLQVELGFRILGQFYVKTQHEANTVRRCAVLCWRVNLKQDQTAALQVRIESTAASLQQVPALQRQLQLCRGPPLAHWVRMHRARLSQVRICHEVRGWRANTFRTLAALSVASKQRIIDNNRVEIDGLEREMVALRARLQLQSELGLRGGWQQAIASQLDSETARAMATVQRREAALRGELVEARSRESDSNQTIMSLEAQLHQALHAASWAQAALDAQIDKARLGEMHPEQQSHDGSSVELEPQDIISRLREDVMQLRVQAAQEAASKSQWERRASQLLLQLQSLGPRPHETMPCMDSTVEALEFEKLALEERLRLTDGFRESLHLRVEDMVAEAAAMGAKLAQAEQGLRERDREACALKESSSRQEMEVQKLWSRLEVADRSEELTLLNSELDSLRGEVKAEVDARRELEQVVEGCEHSNDALGREVESLNHLLRVREELLRDEQQTSARATALLQTSKKMLEIKTQEAKELQDRVVSAEKHHQVATASLRRVEVALEKSQENREAERCAWKMERDELSSKATSLELTQDRQLQQTQQRFGRQLVKDVVALKLATVRAIGLALTRWRQGATLGRISAVSFDAEESVRRSQMLSLIHISEPTRLLSISYAVFCLKKKKKYKNKKKINKIKK